MRAVRRAAIIGFVTPLLLMAGCAETPMGPTVQVMPGSGKTLDAFQADQFTCKQFAENAVAGQAQNANNRAVGAAAVTTVLGAGLGAAIGGGRGAGIGAASGALGGTAIGAGASSNAQLSIQDQYNNAFAQCMYTRGNVVPGMGPVMYQAGPSPDLGLTRPVQLQLIRLGYMSPPADGTLGPQTSNAIARFQGVAGMPVDGMPSPGLLATLQATR
jgi:outer membrane lipoprotein SlyB